jgi:hypothetical protein
VEEASPEYTAAAAKISQMEEMLSQARRAAGNTVVNTNNCGIIRDHVEKV